VWGLLTYFTDLKAVLQSDAAQKRQTANITATTAATALDEGEFREQRRRKRRNSMEGEQRTLPKRRALLSRWQWQQQRQ
jgi:hypothetical protein